MNCQKNAHPFWQFLPFASIDPQKQNILLVLIKKFIWQKEKFTHQNVGIEQKLIYIVAKQ